MPWDVQHQRPASEPTIAHLATDGANLYVRFEAQQREPLHAVQHTNDVGDGTDDEVWIDLWPSGNAGFNYQRPRLRAARRRHARPAGQDHGRNGAGRHDHRTHRRRRRYSTPAQRDPAARERDGIAAAE